jgi:DNA-binding NtrC family response regulator
VSHSALIIGEGSARQGALARWVAEAGFAPRAAETAEKTRLELAELDFELALADLDVLDEAGRDLFLALGDRPTPVTGACLSSGNGRPNRSSEPGLSRLGRLIGSSRPMQRVYDHLLRVARTPASVSSRFTLEPFDGSDHPEESLGVRAGMPIPEMERRLILATLERFRGDQKEAAKTLGISLETIYNRLSVYRASGHD